MKMFKSFSEFLSEGPAGKVEVAPTSVERARVVAEEILERFSRELDTELPSFDTNYKLLKKKVNESKGTLRKDMPVINANQIDEFAKVLRKGNLDIFKPYGKEGPMTADDLKSLSDKQDFLEMGLKDGATKDDIVKAVFKKVPMNKLKPIQEQIYFDKVMNMIGEHGAVEEGGFVTNLTMIVSKDGYIIDGHHRFAAVMISDPTIKQKVLEVPLNINELLKVTLAYGDAIGNKRNP